jgi:vacuolar protein-sorting-associated protein 4
VIGDVFKSYSGSDINIIIRDASFEPLRMTEKSTHFKKIRNNKGEEKFIACAANDPEGK